MSAKMPAKKAVKKTVKKAAKKAVPPPRPLAAAAASGHGPDDLGPIGAHVSSAGGPQLTPGRAVEIGATALQLFTKTPNQWREPEIEAATAAAFREALQASGVRFTTSHDSYLINLASPDPTLRARSLDSFTRELRRCHALGLDAVVSHPGNFIDDRASGLARNADGDELLFVHRGRGELYCDFGHLSFEAGDYIVAFVLPSSLTAQTAPEPTDPRVQVRVVPACDAAAIRYSGRWSQSAYREHCDHLRAAISGAGLRAIGEPRFARFDPPYKPWFLRRNEVVIEVQTPPE